MDEVPPVQPERERAIDLAYRAVGSRDRTVAELRTYLERKRVEPAAVDDAVAELIEAGFLDDARYARRFAEDKRELERWGTGGSPATCAAAGWGPNRWRRPWPPRTATRSSRPRSAARHALPRAARGRPRARPRLAPPRTPRLRARARLRGDPPPRRRGGDGAPPRGLRLSRGVHPRRGYAHGERPVEAAVRKTCKAAFSTLRTEFGQPGAERPGRRTRGRP